MLFINLINSVSNEAITQVISDLYHGYGLENEIESLKRYFNSVSNTEKNNTGTIIIQDDNIYLNLNDVRCSLSGESWNEIPFHNIIYQDLPEVAVAKVIWEITYYGYGRDYCIFTNRDPQEHINISTVRF